MSYTLFLPQPTSVWKLYRGTGRRRHRSPEYEAWLTEAGLACVVRPRTPLPQAEVVIVRPADCRLDIDNGLKAILDLLQMKGYVGNDKHVKEMHISQSASASQWIVTIGSYKRAA